MSNLRKISAFILFSAFLFGEVGADGTLPTDVYFGFATPAEARIGHPLTPLSYAGVARRTARRTVRRTAVRLSTLPAGCVYGPYYGAYYYRCGAVYYAREGGVYVQIIIE
ncbi:hypothetical protein [Mesorhizobium sp. YR577]|uniref:hypothetical protein n=1 Tax=Mesorhizobium sp. YR577 TaxID=1884373 RepID=UPI0008EF0093|nr:hypothetical protein [Mesorhizobium sp. YR577]SFU22639.1 hypothetical protein SAMN05518861_1385 [Mesorhizobium sp. YR577]